MDSHGAPDLARPDTAGVTRIERMARDLAAELREAPDEERDELYAYAAALLREETTPLEEVPLPGAYPPRPLGAFGVALLLLFGGGLVFFLIPPVGVLLLLASALATVWGVLGVALPHGRGAERRPDG